MTTASPGDSPLAIGFLTVVDQQSQGLVGGYLVLNAHARPLEFHCTVPIRPNRAQEILYGPTLQPFLYGEQIGPTLINTSKLRPLAVFTDCQPALAAASHVEPPLWLVMPPPDATAEETVRDTPPIQRLDAAHAAPAGWAVSRRGRNLLARPGDGSQAGAGSQSSDAELANRLEQLAETLDLSEPFERIRAAIQESQRGGR